MKTTPRLVLVLGLAFVFIAFGIDKFLFPDNWLGYVPGWIPIAAKPFLYLTGAFDVLLGVLLLLPRASRVAAIACAAFIGVIVFTLGWNEIVIRDIGLLAMAVALALMPAPIQYRELHELRGRMRKR